MGILRAAEDIVSYIAYNLKLNLILTTATLSFLGEVTSSSMNACMDVYKVIRKKAHR